MTLVILIMTCIAVTVSLAGLITCIKDAISLDKRIRERDLRDRQARAHERQIIAEHERHERERGEEC
ncbi:MAG: hypothetical protein UCI02_04785 [Bifidobacterium criceti]|nr:hypothetical protein [Bifidobacterium criceti]